MQTQFAFGATAQDVFVEHLRRDTEQAVLSPTFRRYYRLRPFIPIRFRHLLQRGRNQSIDVPENWYLPSDFVEDFMAAVRAEPDTVAIHPWPENCNMAAVLTHDVETQAGMDYVNTLAAVEEEYGLRSAWNFVPHKYDVDLDLIQDLQSRGHEVGVHGYNHDGRLFESRRTFERRTGPINGALAEYNSTGFRAPMAHRNLEWMQDLDVDYDASCFDVDPYQGMPGGVGGVWPFLAGRFVEFPYTLPQDHTLLVSLGETTPRIWIEKLAYLRNLSGMAMLITHPDYLSKHDRLPIYRQFLEHLVEEPNCWHALPADVALWWRQRSEMKISGQGESTTIVGAGAERARLFRMGTLLGE